MDSHATSQPWDGIGKLPGKGHAAAPKISGSGHWGSHVFNEFFKLFAFVVIAHNMTILKNASQRLLKMHFAFLMNARACSLSMEPLLFRISLLTKDNASPSDQSNVTPGKFVLKCFHISESSTLSIRTCQWQAYANFLIPTKTELTTGTHIIWIGSNAEVKWTKASPSKSWSWMMECTVLASNPQRVLLITRFCPSV